MPFIYHTYTVYVHPAQTRTLRPISLFSCGFYHYYGVFNLFSIQSMRKSLVLVGWWPTLEQRRSWHAAVRRQDGSYSSSFALIKQDMASPRSGKVYRIMRPQDLVRGAVAQTRPTKEMIETSRSSTRKMFTKVHFCGICAPSTDLFIVCLYPVM